MSSNQPPTSMPTLAREPRNLQVDALRGLAASFVVLMHFAADCPLLADRAGFDYRIARFAVALFFMISGFVIYRSAEQRSAGSFLWARAARLYPTYWSAVLLAALLVWLDPRLRNKGNAYALDTLWAHLTMFQEFVGQPRFVGVYWTLHIELCFYLVVACCLAARRLSALPGLLLLATLAQLCFRIWWKQNPSRPTAESLPDGLLRALTVPLMHVHLFLAGVVLARRQQLAPVTQWFLLSCCILGAWGNEDRSATLLVVGVGGVLWLASAQVLTPLQAKPLVFLGTISYSLYLIHMPVGAYTLHFAKDHGASAWCAYGLCWLACLAVASVITFGIERPAQRWFKNLSHKAKKL